MPRESTTVYNAEIKTYQVFNQTATCVTNNFLTFNVTHKLPTPLRRPVTSSRRPVWILANLNVDVDGVTYGQWHQGYKRDQEI